MKLLTRKQAAEIIGVSIKTLADWQSTGRYDLPTVQIGARLVRYRLGDIERFVESHYSAKTAKVTMPSSHHPAAQGSTLAPVVETTLPASRDA